MKKLHAVLAYINGSPVDNEVLYIACNAARRNKVPVHVIYVIEVKRTLPLTAEIQTEMDKGEKILEGAEAAAESAGCEFETEILQAREIGPAVVDEAVERNCDLIVMGIPYQTRLGNFDIGGTASYVLKSAPARVWLVRGPMSE
ncbi:MAG: universal stress protein [Chloroflexota bacterium]|nr:universal stress protein [Dehalococcoidales bacterium]